MKKFIYVALTALLSVSCVEDEGNYTYTPLNEVTIGNIESNYNKMAYLDKLEIQPELDGSIYGENLDNYEFEWHLCSGTSTSGSNPHEHTTIGTEKDLSWDVDINPGKYNLFFVVKDKANSIETSVSTQVTVMTSFSRGFLLLGGIDGTDRVGLDMVTMAPERDTVLVEGAFDEHLQGLTNPIRFAYSGLYPSYQADQQFIFIVTDDETYSLSMDPDNQFEINGVFSDRGEVDTDAPVKKPIRMVKIQPEGRFAVTTNLTSRTRFYLTEDAIFGGDCMTPPVFYGSPWNRYDTDTSDKLFNFYPTLFFGFSGYSWSGYSFSLVCYVYDTDNDCFALLPVHKTSFTCTKLVGDTPWSYDCKSEGRKLIYGESGKGSGLSYMVMKGNDDNYYIYTIQFPNAYYSSPSNKQLYTVDKSIATDFDKASMYTFSAYRTTMFYAVGDKLYHYDYNAKICESIQLDGEITYLKPEYDSATSRTQLIVATWNESAKKGAVRKYDFDLVPSDLTMTLRDHTDEGGSKEEWITRLKVKDIVYYQH